jgi:hypothetical protein
LGKNFASGSFLSGCHAVVKSVLSHFRCSLAAEEFLAQHPKLRFHFTPTYPSWLNQVELRFAKIQRDVISRGISLRLPTSPENCAGILPVMPNRLGPSVGLTLILESESVLTKSPGRLTRYGRWDPNDSQFPCRHCFLGRARVVRCDSAPCAIAGCGARRAYPADPRSCSGDGNGPAR